MMMYERNDQDFRERMHSEHEELRERITDLCDFLVLDDQKLLISPYERLMLTAQLRAMMNYATCLEERIRFYNRADRADRAAYEKLAEKLYCAYHEGAEEE